MSDNIIPAQAPEKHVRLKCLELAIGIAARQANLSAENVVEIATQLEHYVSNEVCHGGLPAGTPKNVPVSTGKKSQRTTKHDVVV